MVSLNDIGAGFLQDQKRYKGFAIVCSKPSYLIGPTFNH